MVAGVGWWWWGGGYFLSIVACCMCQQMVENNRYVYYFENAMFTSTYIQTSFCVNKADIERMHKELSNAVLLR